MLASGNAGNGSYHGAHAQQVPCIALSPGTLHAVVSHGRGSGTVLSQATPLVKKSGCVQLGKGLPPPTKRVSGH